MFNLPICPYCHTVYSYKDVKNNKEKKVQCYHCKNTFKVEKIKGYILLFLIICTVAVLINLTILHLTSNFISSMLPLFIVSLLGVLLAYLLTPYFTKYIYYKNTVVKTIPENKIFMDENRKVKRSVKNRLRKENE